MSEKYLSSLISCLSNMAQFFPHSDPFLDPISNKTHSSTGRNEVQSFSFFWNILNATLEQVSSVRALSVTLELINDYLTYYL